MNAPSDTKAVDETSIGLYPKYDVTRTDGSSEPGGKHFGDDYFVLNLTTDKHALPAIAAYAKSCATEYPMLAQDLRAKLREYSGKGNAMITVPEITLPGKTLDDGTVVPPIVVPAFRIGQFNCSKNEAGYAVVDPNLLPWTSINYHNSRQACSDVGKPLVTALQSLAIAYDITQQDANWTGGKVGEGKVFQGLHKNSVRGPQDGHYESEDPEERRWHVLSNGERIYDWAGHIGSWMHDDIQGDENGIVAKPFAKDCPLITVPPYPNREKGIGDHLTGDNWSGNALIRGGYWGSEDRAGVFSLDYGWPVYGGALVGFRFTESL